MSQPSYAFPLVEATAPNPTHPMWFSNASDDLRSVCGCRLGFGSSFSMSLFYASNLSPTPTRIWYSFDSERILLNVSMSLVHSMGFGCLVSISLHVHCRLLSTLSDPHFVLLALNLRSKIWNTSFFTVHVGKTTPHLFVRRVLAVISHEIAFYIVQHPWTND